MPSIIDEWDTKNNLAAQGSILPGRRADISDSLMRTAERVAGQTYGVDVDETPEEPAAEGFPLSTPQLQRLVSSAYRQGAEYQTTTLQPRWRRSYNAFNNQHNSDSKYTSARFRGRSRLFRPKTRATARKKQAEAAAALFSTSDAMVVRASDESDPRKLAGAELIGELVRFRLDRASENASVQWFMVAMGAHHSVQMTAVAVSKQYWEYRKVDEGVERIPVMLPDADVVLDYIEKPKVRVERDRPRVMLFPPEDVIRDPAAPWEDQAQESSYFILRHPMSVEAAKTFLEQQSDKSRVRFFDVPEATLIAAAGQKTDGNDASNTRRDREQNGNDRYSDNAVDASYRTVWLHENYFRIAGQDWVFWTLGKDMLISEPLRVIDAYPEQGGARPIVVGLGALEPFKVDPMSPVESWQPHQQEINDIVNLRLDTLKQTIAPLAKVKKGRGVDIKAVQNRSPDTVVYVQDMEDLEFDRPGDVSASSYAEMEKLNADFDDLAGNFSIGSVQTNRQLGETVGGMRMMTSNANALGEFDLRIFVETWVEPVLRQIVKLIQFYESDANVMALAAGRADLMTRFGVSQIDDDLLNSQVSIYVDAGIGSSDPLMSLQKFQQASQMVVGFLGPMAQKSAKPEAIIDEIFGKAGFKNASKRFFNKSVEEDPRLQEAQAVVGELTKALDEAQAELANKAADNEAKKDVARINVLGRLAQVELSQQNQQEQAFTDAALGQVAAEGEREFQREQGDIEMQRQMQQQQQQQRPMGNGTKTLADLMGVQQTDPAQAVQPMVEAITSAMQQMMQMQMQMMQMQQQQTAMLIQALNAPKRVIRDASGQAVGVAPMGPGMAQQPTSPQGPGMMSPGMPPSGRMM